MKKYTISLPDSIKLSQKEVVLALASQLYEMGKLSLGQAADLTGSTKSKFMEILGVYGVSVFNCDSSELDKDIANAKNYHS